MTGIKTSEAERSLEESVWYVVCIVGRGMDGLLGGLQDREAPRARFYVPGMWATVASSAFDRIGEKGKGTGELTRMVDMVKGRVERRFGSGYAPQLTICGGVHSLIIPIQMGDNARQWITVNNTIGGMCLDRWWRAWIQCHRAEGAQPRRAQALPRRR
jgi:hypothetical protein